MPARYYRTLIETKILSMRVHPTIILMINITTVNKAPAC